jgi:hypothetical protein
MSDPLDEYPALTAFIKRITDTKKLFNYSIYGALEKAWLEELEAVLVLAQGAIEQIKAQGGEYDDIILPNWRDETTTELLFTQRLSGDAYLDFLQLGGEDIERDLYNDPPP